MESEDAAVASKSGGKLGAEVKFKIPTTQTHLPHCVPVGEGKGSEAVFGFWDTVTKLDFKTTAMRGIGLEVELDHLQQQQFAKYSCLGCQGITIR